MCWTRFGIPLATSLLLATLSVAGTSARTTAPPAQRLGIDVLTPIGSLPPSLVGQLREPAAFLQTEDGRYLVYDRRAQSVFSVDAARSALTRIVAIGPSDGEILRPLAFVPGTERTFYVLDNPSNYERVQQFYDTGTPLGVFRRFPAAGDSQRLNIDAMLSSGFGPMSVIGRELLTQIPDGQALISQMNMAGHITRRVGALRPTGHERDAELHRALNAGLPLAAPDGSIYFVFTTGIPMFRKYSADGQLLFERHIEGPELDATLQSLPQVWPTRSVNNHEFPNVASTVVTAAIDGRGQLWISLAAPFTYVYDPDGNKVRTVQFRGTGPMTPSSFFFTKDGRVLVTPGCYEFSASTSPR